MLFFLKWEHWAVLDISKFFILKDVHVHSPPIYGRSIKWRNSEERQLMKWVGIFHLGVFWVGIIWVGIFQGGIFLEPVVICFKCSPKFNLSFKSIPRCFWYGVSFTEILLKIDTGFGFLILWERMTSWACLEWSGLKV